jgi:hypothetical protein
MLDPAGMDRKACGRTDRAFRASCLLGGGRGCAGGAGARTTKRASEAPLSGAKRALQGAQVPDLSTEKGGTTGGILLDL